MTGKKNSSAGEQSDKKVILYISAGHLCHDIYTSFLAPILPLLIEKLALSYAAAGFLSVLMRLPSLLSPIVGAWSDRSALRFCFIASPGVTAVVMCLMGMSPN